MPATAATCTSWAAPPYALAPGRPHPDGHRHRRVGDLEEQHVQVRPRQQRARAVQLDDEHLVAPGLRPLQRALDEVADHGVDAALDLDDVDHPGVLGDGGVEAGGAGGGQRPEEKKGGK